VFYTRARGLGRFQHAFLGRYRGSRLLSRSFFTFHISEKAIALNLKLSYAASILRRNLSITTLLSGRIVMSPSVGEILNI
jgi:hypothetical protein